MNKTWQGADGAIYIDAGDGSGTYMDFSDDSPEGVIVYCDIGYGPEPFGEFDLSDLRNFLAAIDGLLED